MKGLHRLATERSIVTQAYIWLGLPILLFIGFWFRPLVGLPVVGLLLYSFWKILIKRREALHVEGYNDVGPVGRDLWIFVAIVAYVVVSGIGGLMAQIPNDHAWRNGIFFDICRHDWPVCYPGDNGGEDLLCYYFAFWLPAAVVSKMTGTILAGDLAQIFYAAWGTWIAINLIFSSCSGKTRWCVLVVFILFNAWDLVTAFFFSDFEMKLFPDIWTSPFSWLSTSSHKFANSANSIFYNYIYNQGIPLWVGLMLMLHERKNPERLMLCFGLIPAFCPIPALALIPYMTWRLLSNFKRIWTVENVTGLLVALLAAIFLLQNDSGGKFRPIGTFPEMLKRMAEAVFFYGLSIAAFLPFIWKDIRKDFLYWSALGMSILMSAFQVGITSDLAWRISEALIILTAAMTCRAATRFSLMKSLQKAMFVFVIAVGSFSSIYNIAFVFHLETEVAKGNRTRKYLWMMNHIHDKENNWCYHNFISENDSFYRQYLKPKTDCQE